jgi:hypothetical protein
MKRVPPQLLAREGSHIGSALSTPACSVFRLRGENTRPLILCGTYMHTPYLRRDGGAGARVARRERFTPAVSSFDGQPRLFLHRASLCGRADSVASDTRNRVRECAQRFASFRGRFDGDGGWA